MEICIQIEKVYFKYHFVFHIFIAVILCLFSPFIMGVQNLDAYQTARILESFFCLMGIILCIPVFLPDFDVSVRELLESKEISIYFIHILRLLQSLLTLIGLLFIFLMFLKQNQCSFPFWKYFFGTLADCLFLGGIGLVVYSIFDYITIAYMIPFLYYILNYGSGKQYLGKFYLFSMVDGSFEETKYLLGAAVIFFIIAMAYRTWNYYWK